MNWFAYSIANFENRKNSSHLGRSSSGSTTRNPPVEWNSTGWRHARRYCRPDPQRSTSCEDDATLKATAGKNWEDTQVIDISDVRKTDINFCHNIIKHLNKHMTYSSQECWNRSEFLSIELCSKNWIINTSFEYVHYIQPRKHVFKVYRNQPEDQETRKLN